MLEPKLDELDLELIAALQLAPRAPWAQIAGPLGVDAATLSRRWTRLRDSGTAWITCHTGVVLAPAGALALAQINCVPGELEATARAISQHPHAYSVEMVSGSADLLISIGALNQSILIDYLLVLGGLPGVRELRIHLTPRMFRDASQWRFDSLSPDQQRDLTGVGRDREKSAERPRLSAEERELILALGEDGRRSITSLAEELDRPESTVRRLLSTLINSGKAVLRCEAALPLTGWPATATFWLDVPPTLLPTAVDLARRLRDTRMCATALSQANLVTVAAFHSVDGIPRYEAQLAAEVPGMRVVDRLVTLRWFKRVGQLLGPDGRRHGFVPMEFWADATASV